MSEHQDLPALLARHRGRVPVSIPLAAILHAHRFDIEGAICSCGVFCGVVCDDLTYVEHLNQELGPRFAIVELAQKESE